MLGIWQERAPHESDDTRSCMQRISANMGESGINAQLRALSYMGVVGGLLMLVWYWVGVLHCWGRDVANRTANAAARSTLRLENLVDLNKTAPRENRRH